MKTTRYDGPINTFLNKFGGIIMLIVFAIRLKRTPGKMNWIVVLIIFVVVAMVLFFAKKLKTVKIVGETLVLGNYLQEVRVPLRKVLGVDHYHLGSWPIGRIQLHEPCEFGETIHFIPKYSFLSRYHWLEELKQEIALHNTRRSLNSINPIKPPPGFS